MTKRPYWVSCCLISQKNLQQLEGGSNRLEVVYGSTEACGERATKSTFWHAFQLRAGEKRGTQRSAKACEHVQPGGSSRKRRGTG